jgi:hypothetical protein
MFGGLHEMIRLPCTWSRVGLPIAPSSTSPPSSAPSSPPAAALPLLCFAPRGPPPPCDGDPASSARVELVGTRMPAPLLSPGSRGSAAWRLPRVAAAAVATWSLFVRLVADGWCWFVLREKYCWLVGDDWFVLREKYCWLVADKPNEQGVVVTFFWRNLFSWNFYFLKKITNMDRPAN